METGNNKIKIRHLLVDEAYEQNSASSQHLSIQLNLDGLSFAIRTNEKFQLLKSFEFSRIFKWQQLSDDLEQIFVNEKFTGKKFQSVHVSIVHQKFSLVPSPLFDSSKQKDYLRINSEIEPTDLVHNELLKSIDALNVFAIPLPLEKMLRRTFGACKVSHHTSILVESVCNLFKNITEPQLAVNINQGCFDILYFAENKLKFCNSFKYHSNEDVTYYLLFTCEQLKLNPEQIFINLMGEIDRNSTLYELLNKYLRKLNFINRPQNFDYSYKFNEIPEHMYFGLLNL